jgi:hypothetical protein
MAQAGSPTQGDVYNWHELTDVQVGGASANNLTSGTFVYQDGSNGITVVPTTAIETGRVRFLPVGVDNSTGSAGDFEVETVKHGAIVVARCDGAIVVGEHVKTSGTTAGRCSSEGSTELVVGTSLGVYLGHVGELEETGNDPTNAADGDLVVIQMT